MTSTLGEGLSLRSKETTPTVKNLIAGVAGWLKVLIVPPWPQNVACTQKPSSIPFPCGQLLKNSELLGVGG